MDKLGGGKQHVLGQGKSALTDLGSDLMEPKVGVLRQLSAHLGQRRRAAKVLRREGAPGDPLNLLGCVPALQQARVVGRAAERREEGARVARRGERPRGGSRTLARAAATLGAAAGRRRRALRFRLRELLFVQGQLTLAHLQAVFFLRLTHHLRENVRLEAAQHERREHAASARDLSAVIIASRAASSEHTRGCGERRREG